MVFICEECVDHPGALCDHRSKAGVEQDVCSGLRQSCLRNTDFEKLALHLHGSLAFSRADRGALVVVCDDLCAVIINEVVPAVLVVGCVAGEAINIVSLAGFRDRGSCCQHIFPCPVVCRIFNAVLVEDCLVVEKGDGVMVLRNCVLDAVAVIEVYNAVIVIGKIDGIVICDIVIEVEEQVIFHVHLGCIGVHPEDVRHLAAGSAGFKECPVVVPVNDVDIDLDTAFSSPRISDLLKAFTLVIVPDVDLDLTDIVRRSGRRGNKRHARHHAQ